MNDVERLRAAMAQPPSEHFADVDLEQVMRLGGRRRLRRRMAIGGGALAVVAVLAGGMIGLRMYQQTPAPTISVAAAAPVGGLVDTGLRDGADKIVLYVQDTHTTPGSYLLVLATVGGNGRLTTVTTAPVDLYQPGFHGVTIGMPGGRTVLFGAFCGPVQKVLADIEGVTGSQKVPSLKTVLFWAQPAAGVKFDPARAKVIAYDANGDPTGVTNGLGQ
ncbi:MAG TPA: hypothetical protein VHZ97_10380 [Pseudonocardiaceae bacterium]|jgi:hypothetical protein|nr:hypothetical protein [Pseudonocardiaceae bacterium]